MQDIIKFFLAIVIAMTTVLSQPTPASWHELWQKIDHLKQYYSQTVSGTPQTGGMTDQTAQNGGNTGNAGGNSSNIGHTVPEINTAAAPTALALLVGGLLLFGERSRHARRIGGQRSAGSPA